VALRKKQKTKILPLLGTLAHHTRQWFQFLKEYNKLTFIIHFSVDIILRLVQYVTVKNIDLRHEQTGQQQEKYM
jgi:hypothetical protein